VSPLLVYFCTSPPLFLHTQSSIATIETKFAQADEELMQLRSNLKHYENLVDEYKSQVSSEWLLYRGSSFSLLIVAIGDISSITNTLKHILYVMFIIN